MPLEVGDTHEPVTIHILISTRVAMAQNAVSERLRVRQGAARRQQRLSLTTSPGKPYSVRGRECGVQAVTCVASFALAPIKTSDNDEAGIN